MQEFLEVIRPFLEPMMVAIAGFVGLKISQYFNSKVSIDTQKQIDNIIKASVLWVESVYNVDMVEVSKEKFEKAKQRSLFLINELGVQVSEEYLDSMIEAFVFELLNSNKEEKQLEKQVARKIGEI